MSHTLTADQSVIYNAETQATGVLIIHIEQIAYETFGNQHYVLVNGYVMAGGQRVAGASYHIEHDTWNTFISNAALTSTSEYDKQMEAALLYIKTQTTSWGLTSDNWTYSNS